ncbi:DUF6301 family protein [Nocardia shimofusensis]|uniref:DUF6301 family protein n=1 Tax=Nocardia shimofusensis TaxID=228596 RepID=UPI0012ED8694|nr:DUF6301 family protein [Nocardia shimofusensis]
MSNDFSEKVEGVPLNSRKIDNIVRVASRFGWTWQCGDLARICDDLGWRIAENYGSLTILATDLELARPEANARSDDGTIRFIDVFVMDRLEAADAAATRRVYDYFADLSEAIGLALGSPTRRRAGAGGEVRWDLAKVVIRLRLVGNSIHMRLANPAHQAWLDEPDDGKI